MSEKKSAAEILSVLRDRVARIERDAGEVASVLGRMVERLESQRAAALGTDPGEGSRMGPDTA